MAKPKRIKPDQPVDLKLGVSERLTIQLLPHVDFDIIERVAKAPRQQKKIPFTLDELDDLIQHVAAELNHTDDKSKYYYLEQIFQKIEYLLETYTDQPESAKEKPFNFQAVRLDEWALSVLEKARSLGFPTNQYNCKVVLSKAQRRTILELDLNGKITESLSVDASGTRTFDFTAEELALICHALTGPLLVAEGKHRSQLLKTVEKITQGLNEGLSNRKRQPRKANKPKTAFQLKITLKDIRPVVWRQFQVMDCTLPELHKIIQAVMGWQNCHLYYFETSDGTYCDPSLCEDMEYADGRRTKLSHFLKQGHQQFQYVYDFGDFWEHAIEIESVFQPEPNAAFPICLTGAGIAPPEDVGGSMGYEEFLKAINDPEHSEHDQYLDWCGGWFDPEAFDLEIVNRVLGKMG